MFKFLLYEILDVYITRQNSGIHPHVPIPCLKSIDRGQFYFFYAPADLSPPIFLMVSSLNISV